MYVLGNFEQNWFIFSKLFENEGISDVHFQLGGFMQRVNPVVCLFPVSRMCGETSHKNRTMSIAQCIFLITRLWKGASLASLEICWTDYRKFCCRFDLYFPLSTYQVQNAVRKRRLRRFWWSLDFPPDGSRRRFQQQWHRGRRFWQRQSRKWSLCQHVQRSFPAIDDPEATSQISPQCNRAANSSTPHP